MIYHSKSLVLVRKGRAFYATLYQEVFFGNPGGGGSLVAQVLIALCARVKFAGSFLAQKLLSVRAQIVREIHRVIPRSKIIVDDLPYVLWNRLTIRNPKPVSELRMS